MTRPPVVAVTGANGYVGRLIVDALKPDVSVLSLVRAPKNDEQIRWSFVSDPAAIRDIFRERGVTHLVHVAWDMKANSLAALENSCVSGSRNLVMAARAAGVTKLIFISTISAFNGTRSAYGLSKLKVEEMVQQAQGVSLRLGLVYSDGEGGVFGNLKKIIRNVRFVPAIGDGSTLQFLLHEKSLGEVVRRAIQGDFDDAAEAITVAHPRPIEFRELLQYIARQEGRRINVVPVPWRVLFFVLKISEALGLKLNFRSDSVLSFIFQDPAPDFALLRRYGIDPIGLDVSMVPLRTQ